MLEDAEERPSGQTDGPFPIYLGGEDSWPELYDLVKRLVLPGVRVELVPAATA